MQNAECGLNKVVSRTKLHYSLFIIHCILFILLLAGCQSAVLYSSKVGGKDSPTGSSTGQKTEYMVASWYGRDFHGRRTANGETYNMYDFTAAHRTLPFGTRLRLVNEANGKSAVVRINDRGPVPRERDIDVSYRTAQELGFVEAGICRLKVIYLD